MYLSAEHIIGALEELRHVHPFFGITFVACKKAELEVEATRHFSMRSVTRDHMEEHHRPFPNSKHFFQPFYQSAPKWLAPHYPSRIRLNTQTFGPAFVHPSNTNSWAWAYDYVDYLQTKLPSSRRIPAFALCVWLYRRRELSEDDPFALVDKFLFDYHISPEEQNRLLDVSIPSYAKSPWADEMISWEDLPLPRPPDVGPERGGRLAYLRVSGAGPIPSMEIEPAERLTLVAGDNGLGKTFLLDCAWWALTGCWASMPAAPREDGGRAFIEFNVRSSHSGPPQPRKVRYNWKSLDWEDHPGSDTLAGLVVYACVDGSYAVWDPVGQERASVYGREEVWNGVTEGDRKIEGLVRDWRNWQTDGDGLTFQTFLAVLKGLSPSDLGVLEPGPMTRVPHDRRKIPTIIHRYGQVPIVYASAAVKRVLSLAYLMVWAWSEHRIHCHLAKRKPERRIVVLIDEIEAHLHPRWQRQLLPALVNVVRHLGEQVEAQLIVSTHSPLVMASSETIFADDGKDALLHLDLQDDAIALRKLDHMKYGKVDRWLTSPVFGLAHPRSMTAEEAIKDARRLQKGEVEPTAESVRDVSDRLCSSLTDDDEFWPRWIGFAERYGVYL